MRADDALRTTRAASRHSRVRSCREIKTPVLYPVRIQSLTSLLLFSPCSSSPAPRHTAHRSPLTARSQSSPTLGPPPSAVASQFLISLLTLPLAGRYLERVWGQSEFLKFVAVVVVVSNIIAVVVNWLEATVLGDQGLFL